MVYRFIGLDCSFLAVFFKNLQNVTIRGKRLYKTPVFSHCQSKLDCLILLGPIIQLETYSIKFGFVRVHSVINSGARGGRIQGWAPGSPA